MSSAAQSLAFAGRVPAVLWQRSTTICPSEGDICRELDFLDPESYLAPDAVRTRLLVDAAQNDYHIVGQQRGALNS